MRTLSALLALACLACGGPTGPEPTGPTDVSFIIAAGNEQADTILQNLPTPPRVSVTSGGSPIEGQVVNWTVVGEQCGSPSVGTSQTDSRGEASIAWTLGEQSHQSLRSHCHLRALAVRGDSVLAEQVFRSTPLAEYATRGARSDFTLEYDRLPGGWINLLDVFRDDHGNPVRYTGAGSGIVHLERNQNPGGRPSVTMSLVVDSAGTGSATLQAESGPSSVMGANFDVVITEAAGDTLHICLDWPPRGGDEDTASC